MQQYKVGVTFKSRQKVRYVESAEVTHAWYLDAESDIMAIAAVLESIRENGPDDGDIKGLALIELENTRIL